MFAVDIASRFLHVLTAIVLLGGSTFALLIVSPVLNICEPSVREQIVTNLRGRWKRFVHLGIALFLITGFYNYIKAMPNHKGDGLYHALIGTKIVLAMVVFFLASALVGRSRAFAGMRESNSKWLTILCAIGIVIVAISSFVKVRGF